MAESARVGGLEHDPVVLATAAASIVGVDGDRRCPFARGVPVQHPDLAGFSGPSDDLYPVTVGVVLLNEVVQIEDAKFLRLLDENRFEALNALGETARTKLRDAIAQSGFPGQVTGAGSLFRILLHARPLSDYRSALATEREKAQMARLNRYFLNHGFRMASYGMGNLSTVITEDDVNHLASVLRDGLEDLSRNVDDEAA